MPNISGIIKSLQNIMRKDHGVWEHKLPEGQKSYSKTKPIQKSEFASLKEWWSNRTEKRPVC